MLTEIHTRAPATSARRPPSRRKRLVEGWIDAHRDDHGIGFSQGQRAAGGRWAPRLCVAPRGFRGGYSGLRYQSKFDERAGELDHESRWGAGPLRKACAGRRGARRSPTLPVEGSGYLYSTRADLEAILREARTASDLDEVLAIIVRRLDAVVEVVQKAHERCTLVSVCGELAGDPAGALVLLGAGVDPLGMSPAGLARVKRVIRSFTVDHARALLGAALDERDGRAVHDLLNAALDRAGLL